MQFLSPGYVFFTTLFVVPIVIHLIGRRRAHVRRFAAIELLLASDKRVARRTQVQRWLLLALRALAIATVPLVLSKPFVETASDSWHASAVGGAQSAVIVIDDSMSMSAERDGQRLLDAARARARRIVNGLGAESDGAILLASRPSAGVPSAPVQELTSDRGRLLAAIAEIGPSYRATDVTGALRRAAQMLETSSSPARRIYLVSDLAAHGFSPEPWGAGGRAPPGGAAPEGRTVPAFAGELVPIDVSEGGVQNRAIVDLRTEPRPELGPRGLGITVDVANFGAEPVKDLLVTVRVDGHAVTKGLVDLPAHGRGQKRFVHVLPAASELGAHEVAAELAADALAADDKRFARVNVRREVRVLLVDGDARTTRRDDEAFYLETALRPGDRGDAALTVATVTPEELGSRRLLDYDVVFLCNVKTPDGRALTDYVRRGGGLFIALGDNTDPDEYSAALGPLLPQPLQALRSVGATRSDRDDGERRAADDAQLQRLGRLDGDHPLIARLASEHATEALPEARFSRYALLRPRPDAAAQHRVLIHFADGAPALVESTLGDGRVLLFASTIDRDWNDLPLLPVFLPLMQEAARYLAKAPLADPEAQLLVGERHEIPLQQGDLRVEVTQPSGREHVFEQGRVAGRRALPFDATVEPGVYRVSAAGKDGVMRPKRDATFVVNVDAAESDLTKIDAARLRALAAGGGARVATLPRRKVELWHALGAALLLLLLGEALLLRRK